MGPDIYRQAMVDSMRAALDASRAFARWWPPDHPTAARMRQEWIGRARCAALEITAARLARQDEARSMDP